MGEFRDRLAERLHLEMRVHINPDGARLSITPFSLGLAKCTDIMKTEVLKQALAHYGLEVYFDGARREEENHGPGCASVPSSTRTSAGTSSSDQSCGSCKTPGSTSAKTCGCSRCQTGPSLASGNTSIWKTSISSTSTARRCARWWSCTAR